ncbi:ribosome recycling factor [Rickettsiales endosymbiont of Stachyamoeba lipophora]|uniref:ribosome recycling factor n=1 Tax=Rickettsiales endosymbiont of Stachyamoeba lipophora TaxID=2486578 RepID=UPI000F647E60|nr:ribosome recycling factor [Rickettsiales endosymbiont of Stachyamoeba lipophora]AZL15078.1 ribosome recycling factor [Rickettsiales endosymbiont of Stachyamoeba lipophora]
MTENIELLNDLKKRMDGAINSFNHNLKGLRTGRASANLLDHIVVEAYGDRLPIAQLATVTVSDARMLTVQVWDKTAVKSVEKAIANADLGLNPSSEGQLIRIPLPPLSEDRRKELVKVSYKYAEESKVSIRNVRRDVMDEVKKLEKDKQINEDTMHSLSDQIQKITDEYIKKIDELVKHKEQEILTV